MEVSMRNQMRTTIDFSNTDMGYSKLGFPDIKRLVDHVRRPRWYVHLMDLKYILCYF